jgi:membrane protease subunit (stomatin/prohibitin family)
MVLDKLKSLATFSWVADETKSMYVARPEHAVGRLIYQHPDKSIPRGTKITVRSDECALFFREGKFVARINAGTELLDTANLPFLGHLLIDNFTDANHFICELFFVSLNESILNLPAQELGQYRDLNSGNVVGIQGGLSYTVKVNEPVKIITQLGGQSAQSADAVHEILNGRMLNFLRKAVATRSQQIPVLSVVSNLDAEAISQEIRHTSDAEFLPLGIGLGRIYDLFMSLDQTSLDLLRDYGKQEANLSLQEKGSRIASAPGFAEFNLVQGQRAALEGLGQGMASGKGPMVMTGGMGMDLTRRPAPSTTSHVRGPRGGPSVLNNQAMFLVAGERGMSGPFSARQVALLAISKNIDLADLTIRSTEDPEDVLFSANLEPLIVNEYKRRAPPASS